MTLKNKLKGPAKLDFKTKNLVAELKQGDIAVIAHENLDEIAAESLVEAGITAVINIEDSMTGFYPNQGPRVLLRENIPLIDKVEGEKLRQFLENKSNCYLTIADNKVYHNEKKITEGRLITKKTLENLERKAEENFENRLKEFVENTFNYVIPEKELMFKNLELSDLPGDMYELINNKHCVIVVRGKDYQSDLKTISEYINQENPILIGVDGGGDALLDRGFIPDVILGDMDSVSDRALKKAKYLLVHAYPNGEAPGGDRLQDLGLKYYNIPAPGTSEDVALLTAFQLNARLLIALGTHTHVIDFLEKGRKGMASTFLARLKVGEKLVDAKGVSQLYRPRVRIHALGMILFAAIIPVIILASLSPVVAHFFRLIYLYLRLLF
ncbi:thiamin pyrophosphokinase [Natranaerobius trueperi]|uniref:Thiamin pyrophosphokinase n=1 Tax=Natranaerobius trueperi TaxID=759412 RepID=A0A226BYH7_9FIRM|nr:thiamin pyrophosphokinase [Natranaerobius trueperi]